MAPWEWLRERSKHRRILIPIWHLIWPTHDTKNVSWPTAQERSFEPFNGRPIKTLRPSAMRCWQERYQNVVLRPIPFKKRNSQRTNLSELAINIQLQHIPQQQSQHRNESFGSFGYTDSYRQMKKDFVLPTIHTVRFVNGWVKCPVVFPFSGCVLDLYAWR